jgi:hypothetical protein
MEHEKLINIDEEQKKDGRRRRWQGRKEGEKASFYNKK